MTETHLLQRPGGRIAYDSTGNGPPVVCVPGMGDLRSEYRLLRPHLTERGFRVVTMDLRGHGDSDTSFTDLERTTSGEDVVALLVELDAGPAHLVGTSYGAAAVVWAAAETPGSVASVTLIGPFVRDLDTPWVMRAGVRLLLTRPWGARAWGWWYRRLYGTPPADLDAHVARLQANLAEPGRLEAARRMALSSSAAIDPRLDEITAPTAVVMGTADPDFPDPAGEARAVADRTGGRVVLAGDAGHYPHVEQPELVARTIGELAGGARPAA